MRISTWEDWKADNNRKIKLFKAERELQVRLLNEEKKRNALKYDYEKHRLEKYGDYASYLERVADIAINERAIELKIRDLDWRIEVLSSTPKETEIDMRDDYAYDVARDNLLAFGK